jgi:hypothetical protein
MNGDTILQVSLQKAKKVFDRADLVDHIKVLDVFFFGSLSRFVAIVQLDQSLSVDLVL